MIENWYGLNIMRHRNKMKLREILLEKINCDWISELNLGNTAFVWHFLTASNVRIDSWAFQGIQQLLLAHDLAFPKLRYNAKIYSTRSNTPADSQQKPVKKMHLMKCAQYCNLTTFIDPTIFSTKHLLCTRYWGYSGAWVRQSSLLFLLGRDTSFDGDMGCEEGKW